MRRGATVAAWCFLVAACGDEPTLSQVERDSAIHSDIADIDLRDTTPTTDVMGLPGIDLLDPKACADCHPSHFRDWSGSMHAYAGLDPVFRAMNARGQRETNGALGDFCVKCHAPVALALGQTTDGLNLDTLPDWMGGVTCGFCHSVDALGPAHEPGADFNNPLQVAFDGILRGNIADPKANSFHQSVSAPHFDRNSPDSARFCGSCHDVVVPSGLHLETTYSEWTSSAYVDGPTCATCHMPGYASPIAPGGPDRVLHSHAMAAVDTALVPFPGVAGQALAIQAELNPVIGVILCVSSDDTGTHIRATLRNRSAGHAFPSGSSQDRRLTIEVMATHAEKTVFEDHSWWFGREMLDQHGNVTEMFWEAHARTGEVLAAPQSFVRGSQAFAATEQHHDWQVDSAVTTVAIRAVLRPLATPMLDSLVASGDLDPALLELVPTFVLGNTEVIWDTGKPECVESPLY